MKILRFTATNKDGMEVEYEVIATYEDEETKKSYIVYTDKKLNDKSELNVYSSLFKLQDGKIRLFELENQQDKDLVDELLQEILTSLK